MALNRMELFVQEYLIDLNATQAAIRAGYSARTAESQGSRLLRNVKVQNAIQKAMQRRSTRTEITADMVLREYAKIGFADIKDFLSYKTALTQIGYDGDGKPVIDYSPVIEFKPSEEVDGTMINEVSVSKDGVLKFKLHDKKGALDSMARHLGMFNDKLEHSGEVSIRVSLPKGLEVDGDD